MITHNWADIMTDLDVCLSLARLWDDPKQNNFDCGWDWREEHMGKLKQNNDVMETFLAKFDAEGW